MYFNGPPGPRIKSLEEAISMQRSIWMLCAALVLLAVVPLAKGEVFILHSGGRIEGDLVNADQQPRTTYIISLANGGQITLDASLVEKVEHVRPELAEYDKLRRQSPDTVKGHLQMAKYCREHKLSAEEKSHLKRVVELEPDQPDARRLLGYRMHNGQWMTFEEEQAEKGLVLFKGQWITHQDAELRQHYQKQRAAEIQWIKKISRWRKWMDGKEAEQGKKNLRAITDPMAIAGLSERLIKKVDSSSEARQIYVEALAHINTMEASSPMATCAMDDPVEETRLICLDELVKQTNKDIRQAVTNYFVRRMRNKHATNADINRAGVALGRLKDPSTIDTLIESLVTAHEQTIQPAGNPGQMTAAFPKKGSMGPGSGISMNQQPLRIVEQVENADVLKALVDITGQSFGYDQRAWATWYKNQKAKGLSVESPK